MHKSCIPGHSGVYFFVMVCNICGYSVCNLLHGTLLVPRILWRFPDFWKICALLTYMKKCHHSSQRQNQSAPCETQHTMFL